MKTLTLQGKKLVELEEKNLLGLEYYLVCTENEGDKTFGIAIMKYQKNELMEIEETGMISSSKESVEQMIDILVRNTVTPMGLLESVDEMVSVRISG